MKARALRILAMAVVGTVAAYSTRGVAATPNCGLNNGQAAKGKPIEIGAIVSATGLDDFSSSAKAARAYFKCVNDNGGINGRPVEYTVEDDQWRPDVAAQAAARLVKDKKVVAMIGGMSIPGCGANAALYARENVLEMPAVGVVRECFSNPNIAPLNAGPRLSAIEISRFIVEKFGAKSLVCLTPNVPGASDWICGGMEAWGKLRNVAVTPITFDPSSADMAQLIRRSASVNPDAIVLTFPGRAVVDALLAAEQQHLGGKIKFVGLASSYSLDLPKAVGPYWNDRYWVNLEFAPLDSNGPDNQNWKAIMDAYGTPADPRDNFSEAGYLAAKIATEALLKVDPVKLDRAAATDALRAVKDFRSDMLCRAWYFGKGNRHNANHSGLTAVVTGDQWRVASDCIDADDPELADVFAAEKSAK